MTVPVNKSYSHTYISRDSSFLFFTVVNVDLASLSHNTEVIGSCITDPEEALLSLNITQVCTKTPG